MGWKPDLPDIRDLKFSPEISTGTSPDLVDLSAKCPPVYNQGNLGSCTANAIAAALEFDQIKQGLQTFVPSRLFIYYNERSLEGTIKSDSGAQIRDGIKVVNTLGACPETEWPYVISKFKTKPTVKCFTDGKQHPSVVYQSVAQDIKTIENTLASGFPIVFGFTVYSEFESAAVAKTGIVPMPTKASQLLGGHAVLAVGYDRAKQMVLVRNSWGSDWALKGYFWLPYAYISNPDLASDFWVIQSVK